MFIFTYIYILPLCLPIPTVCLGWFVDFGGPSLTSSGTMVAMDADCGGFSETKKKIQQLKSN